MDTYEQLDALGTCFPWCTMPQEKPIKCKSSLVVTISIVYLILQPFYLSVI